MMSTPDIEEHLKFIDSIVSANSTEPTKMFTCSKGHKWISSMDDHGSQEEIDRACTHCKFALSPEEKTKKMSRVAKAQARLAKQMAEYDPEEVRVGRLKTVKWCSYLGCCHRLEPGEILPYKETFHGFGYASHEGYRVPKGSGFKRHYYCSMLHIRLAAYATEDIIFRMDAALKNKDGIWISFRREWIAEPVTTGFAALFDNADYYVKNGYMPVWHVDR